MRIELDQPGPEALGEIVAVLGEWQDDAAPFQLHPGDLGWQGRLGGDATAATTRIWRSAGRILAVGELDGDGLVRLAVAPDVQQDESLARQLAVDLSDPGRGVLGAGAVSVEAPPGALLGELLSEQGWEPDESWTPMRRHLAHPVQDPGVRIEVVGPALVSERVAVHRAAFRGSTFTADSWHAMAAGPAYADARCLLAYDDRDVAVAGVTVWSAGPGRPGLLEPMGTHHEHRGLGHGRAVTLAAAAALRELGSSSATVCTPTANVPGAATYRAAGFTSLPDRRDLSSHRRSEGSGRRWPLDERPGAISFY